ncbi:MAG: thioredoxin family protein [Bacteroidetes bacterium]|nr:thioredoxin family protein [Bacteroidota bacterium]
MKLSYPVLIVLLFVFSHSPFGQTVKKNNTTLKWYTSIADAQKISNETKKPIFALFTGSDWCGWCHRLQDNVFSKQSFIDWAKKNVVLLELDYPRKIKLPPQLQQQNAELQQVFRVSGFPTIWMFYLVDDTATKRKNIQPLGSLGYPNVIEEGKEEVPFLHTADSILNIKIK